MLSLFVIGYLLLTILVGIWAARRVSSAEDYALAGRGLSLGLSATSLFATWFGSETLLGASAEFVEKGLMGIIEEPLGAILSLTLIGLFFAKPIYQMKVMTFGDFFKIKYGERAEFLSSLVMVFTFFGWIAAQFAAVGIVMNTLLGVPLFWATVLGACIVVLYTYIGGMWAVSVTDLIQTVVIIGGLIFVFVSVILQVGGFEVIIAKTPAKHFEFLPESNPSAIANYVAAWMTLGLGAIPSQDIFQRVMSSKSEKVAVLTCYLAALMYMAIVFMPLITALTAHQLYPDLAKEDLQMILPQFVMQHSPLVLQVCFFGALLSAIMSTASGAMLAPATVLAENILKPLLKTKQDHSLLFLMRISVVLMAVVSFALTQMNGNIFELAAMASASGLVSLFVPIWAALYWKKYTPTGAVLSMLIGLSSWLLWNFLGEKEASFLGTPPVIVGFVCSFLAMLIGNRWGEIYQTPVSDAPES
ncbi:MAG: sodium:solute symporter [Cytophagales bacterium]|nr:MAG: sodium:solute symporter [Cytophagales bacterium]